MVDVTAKHIDGITDLVVVAPIRDGFIEAFENITYGTRLKLGAEALNRVRISAREHERVMPFPDVTQRILNLLDFRVGVIDKDLFALVVDEEKKKAQADGGVAVDENGFPKPAPRKLEARRYLYLSATFEGGWEPYMRLIWNPLGPFLDLLFCNCEGYVTATEHSCEEYLQWVRDNQADSAIFYSTTGLTTRDQEYLSRIERLQRDGADDLALTKFTMPYPDEETAQARKAHLGKSLELGLEALTVLYKLADYYPPEWMTGNAGGLSKMTEGHRLFRVAREILRGWDDMIAWLEAPADPADKVKPVMQAKWAIARETYSTPLNWYASGKAHLLGLEAAAQAARRPDPDFDRSDVQAGILKALGSAEAPIRQGALLMFTVRDTLEARAFLKAMLDKKELGFEGDACAADIWHRSIGFTPQGLLQMGLSRDVMERFPKEFQEGLTQRSGLVGDQREYHPRNWILPGRNGPVFTGAVPPGTRLAPVELDEVDFVIQLRSASTDRAALEAEVKRIAAAAGPGATLEAIDWMHVAFDPRTGRMLDYFGYQDGISQPKPIVPKEENTAPQRDRVKLGEVLLGYGNDRTDAAPGDFETLECSTAPAGWRKRFRREAQALQKNGSYLVVRKIAQETKTFDGWLDEQALLISAQLCRPQAEARALLKAAIMGRDANGCPMAKPNAAEGNDFDYQGDREGLKCPHAAHIRRANPRRTLPDGPVEARAEFDRPTPRIVRRGMLFGEASGGAQGLMFMAYNASIAEQYEVIQRWLNGGNSTDVASANNDPLTGVQPKDRPGTFRFVAKDAAGNDVVIRATLPRVVTPENRGDEPGRHPFTPLHWGLYLLVPSRTALGAMANATCLTSDQYTMKPWAERYTPMREPLEDAVGRSWMDRVEALDPKEAGAEWKRLLEDFDARDPSEADISPHVWAAIRYYHRGAIDLGQRAMLPPPMGVASTTPQPTAREVLPGTLPNKSADLMAYSADVEEDVPQAESATDHDWIKPEWKTQNVIICAGRKQVRHVLADWTNFTVEEQLNRIHDNSGPIYVTQQPDNAYFNPKYKKLAASGALDYHSEAHDTNAALLAYPEKQAFEAGYRAGQRVLDAAKRKVLQSNALAPVGKRDYFKIELRRQFLLPAIAELWKQWYGIPDGKHMKSGGWTWKRIVTEIAGGLEEDAVSRTKALCPGDFLSPSRNSFYPRPSDVLKQFASEQGIAILNAGKDFVTEHRASGAPPTPLVAKLFAATPNTELGNKVLARNIIGTMIGAIPPMDANLRNILYEWLNQKSLWRHQAAMQAALKGQSALANHERVKAALGGAISQAMCMRPAPDLLFRTAKGGGKIPLDMHKGRLNDAPYIRTKEGDMVVISLVSATQRSLMRSETPNGDVSIVFGGTRSEPTQGYLYDGGAVKPDPGASDFKPVHACPAMAMAMGGMTGILAALLDSGTIQALPASLIVKISGWPDPAPAP